MKSMKFKSIWPLLVSLVFFNVVQAEPQMVGQGNMRWLGLHLYEIELYTPTGVYEEKKPLDLLIRYQLKIDRDKLIAISEKEVDKIGKQWNVEWTKQLESIWPTVNEGDELILSINVQGASNFYYNGQLRGTLIDPLFGESFTAIWLSPDTREGKLRKQLIGEKNDS